MTDSVTIDVEEAQARLHEMWDALLDGKAVRFFRDGQPYTRIESLPEFDSQRDAIISDLEQTINYRRKSVA